MARRIAALLIACLWAALACGCASCFEGSPTDKKLTSYFDRTAVTGALYFSEGADGDVIIEELPPERLAELIAALDSMALTSHGFHADYYWGGRFGIELAYEDGQFMTYDGTKAQLRSVSVKTSTDREYHVRDDFLEVTNADFWDTMRGFFESIDHEMPTGW